MDVRVRVIVLSLCAALVGIGGCGKHEPASAVGTPPSPHGQDGMAANVELKGQYVDGYGRGLAFTGDGRVVVIGSPTKVGRYVGEGQTFRVELPSGVSAMGYVDSPNKISVSFRNDPSGTLTLFREGSDLAAQARADANHRPVERKAPDFDRSVPLDSYVDLSPDASAEGLFYLYAALRDPPLTDDEKFRLLSREGGEPDAFKRKSLIDKEVPAIDAKMAEWKSHRYYKLTVDPKAWGGSGTGRVPNGFPMMAYTGGMSNIGPYDFDRKGFPASCIANVHLSHMSTPGAPQIDIAMGMEETYQEKCLLSVADLPTAQAIESKRATSALSLLKKATLYFYIVRDYEQGGGKGISVVLTHATVQFGTYRTFGGDMDSAGPPVEVNFPQPEWK